MGYGFAPHGVGADPKDVVDFSAMLVEAAVEDVGRELLGMADDVDDFIEVSLVVAVEAVGGCGRERGDGIVAGHGVRMEAGAVGVFKLAGTAGDGVDAGHARDG